MLDDQEHPNEAGARLMADLVDALGYDLAGRDRQSLTRASTLPSGPAATRGKAISRSRQLPLRAREAAEIRKSALTHSRQPAPSRPAEYVRLLSSRRDSGNRSLLGRRPIRLRIGR